MVADVGGGDAGDRQVEGLVQAGYCVFGLFGLDALDGHGVADGDGRRALLQIPIGMAILVNVNLLNKTNRIGYHRRYIKQSALP